MRSLLGASLILSGCAYVGEPLPPSLKIPEAITDVVAVQRGARIFVTFTPPTLATDGIALPAGGRTTVEVLADNATTAVPAAAVFDAVPWVGKTIRVRVRAFGPSGREAAAANEVVLRVEAPLAIPVEVRAGAIATGVELQWRSPAPAARIFRDEILLATAEGNSYRDVGAQFGQAYRYAVQAVQGAAESELSPPVAITPEDRFAPEVPLALAALTGTKSVELSWASSLALDFASYRIYRDGRLVAQDVKTPVYSDVAVESGKPYRYQVSAVDEKGNESGLSAPVEIIFP